jgi:ATP-binding cassette subfamily B protein
VYALYFPAVEIVLSVGLALLLVASAQRIGAGTLTVGTVAAFLQLLRRFFEPLQDLAEKFNILRRRWRALKESSAFSIPEPAGSSPLAVTTVRRRKPVGSSIRGRLVRLRQASSRSRRRCDSRA